MTTAQSARQKGFCFLELIGTMVIFVGITVASLAGVYWYQHHARKQANTRAAVCDMTAPSASNAAKAATASAGFTTITSASVNSSPRPQAVAVRSTAGLFAGEKVAVGEGTARETVVITPLNGTTIQGVFSKNHAGGVPVNALRP